MGAATLTYAAFLGLAAACASDVAPETLAGIVRAESGFNALVIGVNGPGGGARYPASVAEAVADAKRLIAQGRSIDLGLMQINGQNLGWLGLSIEDAFDPCRNVAAGARVLTSFSGYNTGNKQRGFANGYVQKVIAAQRANISQNTVPEATNSPRAPPATVAVIPRRRGARQFVYNVKE